MTEERLRDLLHDTVADTTGHDVGSDLVERAWRRAQGRRRRQQAVAAGAVLVVAAVGIAGVQLLTPQREEQPVQPAPAPVTPPPTSVSPTADATRPDTSYQGVPVWWAPEDVAGLPALEGGPLPATIDLATPAPDAESDPLTRAVAAYVDTATLEGPDGAVRLVGVDGEQRDLDISGLHELASDGLTRVSAATRAMLSPDGRTLAFPQDDQVVLFDIPSGGWSGLNVPAGQDLRWADAGTLFLSRGSSAPGTGRLVALDGTREGRANIFDVVRPGVDLGRAALVAPWRSSSGGEVAQTYDGVRGTVPGPEGTGQDQTFVVIRGPGGTRLLTLGPTDDPGWALLADWVAPETLAYEVVENDTARVVSWSLGSHDFSVVTTVTGLQPTGHRLIGSYALGG